MKSKRKSIDEVGINNETEQESIINDANENTSIEIEQPKRQFLVLQESVYKNNELTPNELYLLIKLLSASPKFKITYKHIINAWKLDKRALIKASKGLQEKGYLEIESTYKKGSKWKVSQDATFKPINIDSLKDLASKGQIQIETLKVLYLAKKITKQQAQELYETNLKELIRIAKSNWLD